jgi:xanthine dehydrogenase accessory factor
MTTRIDFSEKVVTLTREGEPFAVATVVGRRAPVSAHLGDRAIVYADGRMEGFVGGACSREIIRKQALDALRTRQARLVSIQPDANIAVASTVEHVHVRMTCASEGAVDVYVEPVLPPRRLVVVGATPVAEALARLARTVDYHVVRVVEAAEQRDLEAQSQEMKIEVAALESLATVLERRGSATAAVVASQGHYDEQALETILRSGTAWYVGLVASRKRGEKVRTFLADSHVPGVEQVRYPAGLDLGARTAPEVALSILAQMTEQSNQAADIGEPAVREAPVGATAIDPVCGMEVHIAAAKHQADYEGTTYYFCCPHCRAHFLREPQAWLAAKS